ncbi:hypothetical protein CHU92_05945 [Flavobacterium cyanobacteriorum]|uniref:TonB-dependent receptor plug domain-containing protein n=1 Tax=Flavobacterium cyanobacteriorum TaxID=2022802 RepID=A0A255ZA10_9FLAO|nr:SusC/RagA family TonB-linked outer membrane protein [Flavobacterium cyanobacteriorum]OYQ38251.1 hypothetical protein CHU92_05945 [Flavobacterium cyanobacteriorum]
MRSKFTWIMALFMVLTFNLSFAQEKTVTGTVSDDAGQPLPGVSILVRGTNKSTTTDFDGNYSISVSVGQVLEFSFVGFTSQSATITAASGVINIKLEEGQVIGVIVKDAYRTVSERKATFATTTISAEAFENRGNASIIQSMQGQIAGLSIGTGSGQPGADSAIILRGVGTINGNFEPLFIVDGVPVDEDGFRSINPNDYASITTLKDAAATSIYGNRGSNGVIVLTTKRGSYNQDLKFRYTSQFGYNELQPVNIDLMTSRELLQFQKRSGQGLGSTLSDAEIDVLSRQANTNWSDIFFRKGTTKLHDLSMSVGSANTNNFTSFSYFEQDGIFINTNLKRFTLRNNFTGRSQDQKFEYSLNFNANFSRQSGLDGAGTNSIFFAPFRAALQGLPYLSPYDANGNITRDGGIAPGNTDAITADNAPYVLLNSSLMNTDIEDEFKLITGLNAKYTFMKNVTAGMQLGLDYSQFKALERIHPESILGPFQANGTNTTQFGGLQQESTSRDFRFNSLFTLNYNNTFADAHTIDLTGYVEYIKNHFDSFGFVQRGLDPRLVGTGAAFIDGETVEGTLRPYIPTVSSGKAEEGLFSYFANFDYDYKGKYGFNATVRRDNSFRFIDENKWATFYSLGGRWNIDEESFMEKLPFVDQLKLRASFGTTGNQRINNGSYSALNFTRNLYTQSGGYNGTPGTVPGQIANPDLRWEVTEQTNVGLDFGLFGNRLSGTVDVYRKFTRDLFQSTPISAVNATTDIDTNTGALENKGVELFLKYVIYDKNGWNISVDANTAYNQNRMRDLPDSYNGIIQPTGSATTLEGYPLNTFYVVRYAGVNPSNGNALFYTRDGGLTETIRDEDRVNTGKSSLPVWTGGFNTRVSYKGFEFSTQWSYVADIYRNNLDYADLEETNLVNDGTNRAVSAGTAWQNPGDITSVPRVGNQYNSVDYINSTDRYLEDASFLRLRNVLLGYNFDKKILEKLPFSGVRLYIQAENLVTFTSYRGWDAESNFRTTDRGQYPTPKIYTLGAVVNF